MQPSASRTEDSARTAYEELMLKEEQAATKAAAKKARKLMQKAKKKNKQQAASIVVDKPPAQPSLEDEEEEDQFRLPQAATASLGPAAAPDVPSAEQLPSALRLLHYTLACTHLPQPRHRWGRAAANALAGQSWAQSGCKLCWACSN